MNFKIIFLLTLLVSITLAANIRGFMDEADEQAPGPVEPVVKTGKLFCALKISNIKIISIAYC